MAIEELKGLECFNCKTKVFTKISNDTYRCKGCGHINYRSTDEDNIKYVNACTAMENYHFSDAYNIYHNLYLQANESKFKAQAIFGMLKATYGIIYIESSYVYKGVKEKKKIATFSNYHIVTKSLLDTDYYKEIKELNFDEKDKFLNEIEKLDENYKEIGNYISNPNYITNYEFDYVLLALANNSVINEVLVKLQNMQIESEKIIRLNE